MALDIVAVSTVVNPLEIVTDNLVELVDALTWPVVVFIILVLYKGQIGPLLGSLGGRIKSVSVLGVALEVSELRPVEMASDNQINQLVPAPVFESSGAVPLSAESGVADTDYAIIDLGKGRSWLTSHLYIVALLLERTTARMQYCVFVAGEDRHRYHFEGVAELARVRWALAQDSPWFEWAFAQAYRDVLVVPGFDISGKPLYHQVVSRRGALTSNDTHQLWERFLFHCRQSIPYTPEEIVDPQGLAATLADPSNTVAAYLMGRFDPPTRSLVENGAMLIKPSAAASGANAAYAGSISGLRSALCTALNTIIAGSPLATEQPFASVYPDDPIVRSHLIPANPQGVELRWLHRLLLDRAFRRDVATTSMQPRKTASGNLVSLERDWTKLRNEQPEWIHARWLNAALVERIMGPDLSRVHLRESDLIGKSRRDKARLVLDQSGPVLPLVEDDGRFSRMLDRQRLINAVSSEVAL